MKSSYWIIIGFVAIIISIIAPIIGFYFARESLLHGENMFTFFDKFLIVGVISQILFWGGIIFSTFGLIKYYKEK